MLVLCSHDKLHTCTLPSSFFLYLHSMNRIRSCLSPSVNEMLKEARRRVYGEGEEKNVSANDDETADSSSTTVSKDNLNPVAAAGERRRLRALEEVCNVYLYFMSSFWFEGCLVRDIHTTRIWQLFNVLITLIIRRRN